MPACPFEQVYLEEENKTKPTTKTELEFFKQQLQIKSNSLQAQTSWLVASLPKQNYLSSKFFSYIVPRTTQC